MELQIVFYPSLFVPFVICLFVVTFTLWSKSRAQHKNLPPSPPCLPIIGHLHLLNPKEPLQRVLLSLSQKYGPIMLLRFGSRNVVVVSSPSIAEECFTKNDVILANRPNLTVTRIIGYDNSSLVASSYGEHWRNLRRVSAIEVFSTNRTNALSEVRRGEVREFIRDIHDIVSNANPDGGFSRVELRPLLMKLTYSVMMSVITGKSHYHDEERETEYNACFRQLVTNAATAYPGDFMPFLKLFDFQGYVNKIKKTSARFDAFFQNLIDHYRRHDHDGHSVISHLLALQVLQPEYYTDIIIKSLLLDIMTAGTESLYMAIEWAMSNLLNQPQMMMKAKHELDAVVGQERMIEESDINNLPYLQGIVWETLRLYPSNPLLIPHSSSADCTIGGYHVPANSMFFFNVWAIQTDPSLWDDASSFKPDRFLGGEIQSQGFKLIPFGHGRRSCPGNVIANRVLALTLGAMVQAFEWNRIGDDHIDMTEKAAVVLGKMEPLVLMCRPCDNADTLISLL